jgi:formamidopyrimidine-DNA glycosylase
MPELPEVETICRGLKPQILNQPIQQVLVYQSTLRWPIPKNLNALLQGECFYEINRRGKYLLFVSHKGTVIVHLGLSGRLLILPAMHKKLLHEHLAIRFNNQKALCFIDPRKFGAFLLTKENPLSHALLKDLGPEPLTAEFNSTYLHEKIKHRKIPIKQLLMDGHIVAGIGNIYANEALFAAKINPLHPANKLSNNDIETLTHVIKNVLKSAILKGGTTIKDFLSHDGEIGRFQYELKVYGRGGKPCYTCKTAIKEIRLGQRSTFYCPTCQK